MWPPQAFVEQLVLECHCRQACLHQSPPASTLYAAALILPTAPTPPLLLTTVITPNQMERLQWFRGDVIVYDSATVSLDVPYGDYFTVNNRWIIDSPARAGER